MPTVIVEMEHRPGASPDVAEVWTGFGEHPDSAVIDKWLDNRMSYLDQHRDTGVEYRFVIMHSRDLANSEPADPEAWAEYQGNT